MAKRIDPTSAEPPTSSCLLLCEDILLSPSRDKHYLHGVIGKITAPKLPATIGPFSAYVRLSNVYANQQIRIEFSHSSSNDPIFSLQALSPQVSDPLAVHTMILAIPPMKLKKPGRYIFSASHAGVPFATTAIEVLVAQGPNKRRK